MPDVDVGRTHLLALQQLLQRAVSVTADWSYGLCRVRDLAQDQTIIQIKRGDQVETYRGLLEATQRDVQSEALVKRTTANWAAHEYLRYATLHLAQLTLPWDTEDPLSSLEAPEDSCDVEDTSGWAPDELVDAILGHKETSDWSGLREQILAAEDTAFTVEQSNSLAPRLLELAACHRDSNDPQDKPVVWSAIRTGASMLRPDQAHRLRPLLEPGHSIETSVVAVKMLGRIFEAQPPADVDRYPELAAEVYQIAELLLNPYALASSQSAATAQLAIYALAAMASTHTTAIAKAVRELNLAWFARQVARDSRELLGRWSNCPETVAERPRELLQRALSQLHAG
jgi:hypothetical protein